MQKFHHRHKPHLIVLSLLLLLVGVSGYIAFGSNYQLSIINYQSAPEVSKEIEKEPIAKIATSTHIQVPSHEPRAPENSLTTTQLSPQIVIGISPDDSTINNQQSTIQTTLTLPNQTIALKVEEGTSIADMMEQLREQGKISFGGTDYGPGLGLFITEIDGKKQDTRAGMYWVYSVNGQKAKTGVSTYIIQQGDNIVWTYESNKGSI
jgi:hypothetical protein